MKKQQQLGIGTSIILGWMPHTALKTEPWSPSPDRVRIYAFLVNNPKGGASRYQLLDEIFGEVQPGFDLYMHCFFFKLDDKRVCAVIHGFHWFHAHRVPVICISVFTLERAGANTDTTESDDILDWAKSDRDSYSDSADTPAIAKEERFLSVHVQFRRVYSLTDRDFSLQQAFICPPTYTKELSG